MDESEETRQKLEHVHVCVHCGGAFRREEFGARAITSGIYMCPKCGYEGPLNLEIRAVEGHAEDKDSPSDAGSPS